MAFEGPRRCSPRRRGLWECSRPFRTRHIGSRKPTCQRWISFGGLGSRSSGTAASPRVLKLPSGQPHPSVRNLTCGAKRVQGDLLGRLLTIWAGTNYEAKPSDWKLTIHLLGTSDSEYPYRARSLNHINLIKLQINKHLSECASISPGGITPGSELDTCVSQRPGQGVFREAHCDRQNTES